VLGDFVSVLFCVGAGVPLMGVGGNAVVVG